MNSTQNESSNSPAEALQPSVKNNKRTITIASTAMTPVHPSAESLIRNGFE
jgi:hypothetical protein